MAAAAELRIKSGNEADSSINALRSFKFSTNNSIQELLWIPIKTKIKLSAKPIIDGSLRSGIEGLTGILIFIITFYPIGFLLKVLNKIALYWGI